MSTLLKKLALGFGTLLLTVVVVEAVLHLVRGPVVLLNYTAVPESLRKTTSGKLPYVLKPGGTAVHEFGTDPRGYFDADATLTYRINSLGFRGPETTRDKPPGTFRILGLGDSFTFGTGVRAGDTFLSQLQPLLQRGPASVEVLNLGVMGYNTEDEVTLLRLFGLELDPDLVVLCLFLNDAGGDGTHRHFGRAAGSRLATLRTRSHLLDGLLVQLERRSAARSATAEYRASFAEGSQGWWRVQESLRYAVRLAKTEDFAIALVIFPVLLRLDDHPLADVHADIARFAESIRLPVLDLAPAFAGYAGPELWVHPGNQHPNEIGHRIAATALAQFLVERGLVPGS